MGIKNVQKCLGNVGLSLNHRFSVSAFSVLQRCSSSCFRTTRYRSIIYHILILQLLFLTLMHSSLSILVTTRPKSLFCILIVALVFAHLFTNCCAMLTNKVIVVTGASSGIGATLSKKLVSLGAKVVFAARNVEALQAVADSCNSPDSVLVHQCDVTRRADHEAVLEAALAKFGTVSCWVNNAGVGLSRSVMDLTDEDVDSMISMNTKSVLYGMQTSVRYFKTVGQGHVINVSSFLARCPTSSIRSMYSASKAAVNSLTANLRMDMKAEGFNDIHIALFSPGLVATPFGLHSKYGGPDNSKMPGAQDVEEVADVMVQMIQNPSQSVDVYSREKYKDSIIAYLSAADIRDVEASVSIPRPTDFSAQHK